MINIENLTKRFDDRIAVAVIDLFDFTGKTASFERKRGYETEN